MNQWMELKSIFFIIFSNAWVETIDKQIQLDNGKVSLRCLESILRKLKRGEMSTRPNRIETAWTRLGKIASRVLERRQYGYR